jgi:hypothetical protein
LDLVLNITKEKEEIYRKNFLALSEDRFFFNFRNL